VIRQREAAVPEQPGGPAQPVASIAPDGLEAFARDLRALRAKANLDYPEMAEASHYEMKTLAAAAGGLRLPTLPVAVAFVRACDGNVAEWEERWQRLTEKITAETAKKRRTDGEDDAEPIEAADTPAALEPPARKPTTPPPPDSEGGEVYVITSAKPRQPGW
jgi:Helix-turn-helix domain